MNTYTTDILVLGSGLAGLSAAIAGKEKGFNVMVCSKTTPGRGSCTAMSQGGFRNSDERFTADDHKKATLAAGYNLNEIAKVETLAGRAEEDIRRLREYGVDIRGRARGYHSYAQLGREGLGITNPMVRYAEAKGVVFISPFFAWELIKIAGVAKGVWGFCGGEDKPTIILAKSVVLATGGAGALFARTDNPRAITGDGYSLAHRAGLPLKDMEFVQFYPLGTAYPGKVGRFLYPILADAGRFVNAKGEDLVEKYGITKLPLAVASRDTLCKAMACEVRRGLGINGAIKLKFNFSDGSWERARKLFGYAGTEEVQAWTRDIVDQENSIPVMPVVHFCMGGVRTDEGCRTDIPGLFAAGEVVGGLHGANRLGGNALAEAAVFGRIAGRAAANDIAGKIGFAWGKDEISGQVAASFKNLHIFGYGTDIVKKVQDIMWNHVGIMRTEESLQKAQELLTGLTGELMAGKQEGRQNIVKYLELKNILQVAEIITRQALERRESCGSHFRLDYPEGR